MPTLNTWNYKNYILKYLYTSFICIHKYITLDLALSWISVYLSSLSQPLLKVQICTMNVYLEPIFHIVEMDTIE
jgi:hypothetical protein